ncbi:hypothetical protein PFICI_01793 [Pestalotiopsis fici W106-1]|uniref:Tyrosinase copper-binding domain-containing protein n=1 Tax=Pestalotiopsis fici (strain W106-1 / CGMCC3.15140) TaxID=1229662 RepID=W3XPS0_PESFW|nr:uncharacterized protein PFICI_01793 [Pestalotiopsis fici W106-1]ETS87965.1 hypothetical protein PFICI_01793 [Pestalotiopsis fici W106-1]
MIKSAVILGAFVAATKAATCDSPVQRQNFLSLSDDDKTAYLDAVSCLTTHEAVFGLYDGATTLWDEQQYLHLTMSNYIHGVGQFLPWHRYYMTLHEKLLQTYCGYTGGIPYWDEQADAANITESEIWNWLGGDGNSSDSQIVTDGPFANLELHLGGWSFNTVIPKIATYHLNRTISESIFQGANQTNVDACFALDNYDEAWYCYAKKPHSSAHAGTGGTMQNPVLSPGDPIFFLHHTNLDRLWWLWQSANLTARLTDMGGSNVPSDEFNAQNSWDAPGANFTDYSGDPANVTTLAHVLSMYDMIPNVTIADIMDIGGEVVCAEYV